MCLAPAILLWRAAALRRRRDRAVQALADGLAELRAESLVATGSPAARASAVTLSTTAEEQLRQGQHAQAAATAAQLAGSARGSLDSAGDAAARVERAAADLDKVLRQIRRLRRS